MWDSLGSVALFGGLWSFLAVGAWAASRTRERELYYRNELLKKAIETPGPESAAVLAHLKEQELATARASVKEKRNGLLTGGMTVGGVGLGLMIFMRSLETEAHDFFLVGLIPLFIGVALIVGSRLVKDES